MKKRFFVFVLLVFLAAALPFLAGAETKKGVCGRTLLWSLTEDGVLTVSGIGEMNDYGSPNDAPWGTAVEKVEILQGVTGIGESAFFGCTGLESVTIPDSVVRIGKAAFLGCTGLTEVTIPEGVKSIGEGAFYGCSHLTAVTVPDSAADIEAYVFFGCSGDLMLSCSYDSAAYRYAKKNGIRVVKGGTCGDSVTWNLDEDGVLTISGTGDMKDYQGLALPPWVRLLKQAQIRQVQIRQGVTGIGERAFYQCTDLTDVTIPDTVTKIGDHAFYGCGSLTGMTIPDHVASIGENAFYGCSSLTSVTIPKTVTGIGQGAFAKCSRLTGIDVAEGNAFFTEEDGVLFSSDRSMLVAFPGGKAGEYSVPTSVSYICNHAFAGCGGLTDVTIPDGVFYIGEGTFWDCSGLQNMTIPFNVLRIGSYAFAGCTGLTNVTIPDTVTKIGDDAFSGCTGLTGVTIPDTVTDIGMDAFSDCGPGLTVSCSEGSAAYRYAQENGIQVNAN